MIVRLPAFITTTWLLAMLPGVGQALMLRQTLTRGVSVALRTVLGTCTGLMLWSTGAAIGLSAVLLATPGALTVVRGIGAIALVVLGIGTLRRSRRRGETVALAANTPAHGRAYLAGLATNLGNPKAGVFAISLLQQFVHPGPHVTLATIALGAIWATTTGLWYLVFIIAVHRGHAFMRRPRVAHAMEVSTGVVLLGLGLGVALGG